MSEPAHCQPERFQRKTNLIQSGEAIILVEMAVSLERVEDRDQEQLVDVLPPVVAVVESPVR